MDLARIRECVSDYGGEDWFEEAIRRLWAERRRREGLKEWDVSTVGFRIRTAREIAGMSQATLAFRLKMKREHISQIERGERDLPVEKVVPFAHCLGVSLPWMLMETDEGGPTPIKGILRRAPTKREQWALKKHLWGKAKAEVARRNALRKQKAKPTEGGESPGRLQMAQAERK